MKKKFPMVGVAFITILIGFIFFRELSLQPSKIDSQNQLRNSKEQTDRIATYPLTEVAKHADKDDCWLAIDNKVYDVTTYVQSGFHPGKDAILNGCGKDATEMFSQHSEKARSMLSKYLIGNLAVE